VKIGLIPFCTIFYVLSQQQKTYFVTWKMESGFCTTKLETLIGNIVWHDNKHIYTHHGNIIMNYATDIAITLVIWLETPESLYVIAHVVNSF
jgi:hypothetical protein